MLSPLYGYSAVDNQAVITVKGKVTKGTCTLSVSEQTVKFTQPILMQNVANIGEREENKIPFSINYNCQDYEDKTPDIEMRIKAGAGTEIINNKIVPINNPTNTSFVIYDCKKTACTLVNFKTGESAVYIATGNGNKNSAFQVELVKKDSAPIHPGTLKAVLALTLIQP